MADAAAGLDLLRRAERSRVSRALHDNVGPALCAAGLQLGLLRSSWPELSESNRELLDSIQEALEAAVDSARVLSYQSDPGLVERCGLRHALEYLTKGRAADLHFEAEPEGKPDVLCRLAGDALVAWDAAAVEGRLSIRVRRSEFEISAPPAFRLGRAMLAALRRAATSGGFAIRYRESADQTRIRAVPRREPR